MRHTPVRSSPARIARSTGAAPRQRGRSEKCRFTIGTCSSTSRRMMRPESHDDAELDVRVEHVADPVGHREPSSSATCFTGVGTSALPGLAGGPVLSRRGPLRGRRRRSARSTTARPGRPEKGEPRHRTRRSRPRASAQASRAASRRCRRAPGREGSAWLACAGPSRAARAAGCRRGGRARVGRLERDTRRPRRRSRCPRGRSPTRWTSFGRTIVQCRSGTDRQPSSYSHSPLDSTISRVDHRLRALADVVDEDPPLDAHLRRSEADAGGGVHRLDHLLGEADDLGVDLLDLYGALAQDGVAENPDRERSHGRHFTGARPAGSPATSCAVAAAMSSTARSNTSRSPPTVPGSR